MKSDLCLIERSEEENVKNRKNYVRGYKLLYK